MADGKPQLSVIIPVLNEATLLPRLLEGLALQKDVALEVIVSDGGSTDGTPEKALALGRSLPLVVTVVEGDRGRGLQLNRGAAEAGGEYLLFLHADSSFPDGRALRSGIDCLRSARSDNDRVAGKFRLRFRRTQEETAFGYYFYESKARLVRAECTHGDQGMLLHRRFFETLVGYGVSSPPMLAETRFADRLRDEGVLVLLPAEIETSARRFEKDGLRERQTLNAIIMNFASAGWDAFFRELSGLYPLNDELGTLALRNMLRRIDALMGRLPLGELLQLWYATGSYVRSNAWQLAFAADARRNFRHGIPPGQGPTRMLDWHERYFDPLTDNAVGKWVTAFLVWIWFKASCFGDPSKG